jgi:hypothetical protein
MDANATKFLAMTEEWVANGSSFKRHCKAYLLSYLDQHLTPFQILNSAFLLFKGGALGFHVRVVSFMSFLPFALEEAKASKPHMLLTA